MVPEGWKLTDLGSLGKWSGGGTPSKSNQDFWNNGVIPWVSPKDMHVQFVGNTKDYITEEAVNKSSTKLYPANTVMVVTRSGILRKRLPVALSKKQVAVNQDIKAFPPHKDVCNYYLASFMWCYNDTLLAKCAKEGTTVESIDTDSLMSFPIKLPSIKEQKKIAEILSTWDKAITTTEKLLKNSQQQKKALMQQLLTGKKRLLDDNGVRYSGEWQVFRLNELCEINPKKLPEPQGGLVSFIAMDYVSEDARLKHYAIKNYSDVSKGYTSFKDKDVILAKITPCFENGKGAYLKGLINGVGFGSTEFHVLRAKKGTCSRYIYYVTCSDEFRTRGEANMQGSAGQKRVTKDYIKSLKIFLPTSYKEQQAIASVFFKADLVIDYLKQKVDYLKQEKKALMQQLLTGKRRVTVD